MLDLFLYNASNGNSFPKYDLYLERNKTTVEVALAGYNREDLEVLIDCDRNLIIKTVDSYKPDEYPNREYIYKNLAKRKFKLCFKIKLDYEIDTCKFSNGLLIVTLTNTNKSKEVKLTIE